MNILENITNLRQVIPIYNCNDMYLYEVIEDYKDAISSEDKEDIFKSFCSSIWSSGNKRRVYTKTIHFNIRKDLSDSDLGHVFSTWSGVEYKYYKSMTKDDNWCSIIRQKINNIYTRYFDREVILGKEYMDLIETPKRLYYEWISGIDMDASTVTELIDNAMYGAVQTKKRLQMEKMVLTWDEYKKIIEIFLQRCFRNCRLLEEYEDKSSISSRLDFITEDHFYAGYINRCLDGEIRKWQKQYYGVRDHKKYKRCKSCGAVIEDSGNKKMYCETCRRKNNLARYKKYNAVRNHK